MPDAKSSKPRENTTHVRDEDQEAEMRKWDGLLSDDARSRWIV